jgi:hypothetical protein
VKVREHDKQKRVNLVNVLARRRRLEADFARSVYDDRAMLWSLKLDGHTRASEERIVHELRKVHATGGFSAAVQLFERGAKPTSPDMFRVESSILIGHEAR